MNPSPGPTPIPCHLFGHIGAAVAVRVVRAVVRRAHESGSVLDYQKWARVDKRNPRLQRIGAPACDRRPSVKPRRYFFPYSSA
jgi:hypothetical protein